MRQIALALSLVFALVGVVWADQAPVVSLYPGDPAPALAVGKWIKGEPVNALEPGKIYVIEFWATWCGPCREAIPHVSALQQQYKDQGVIFIGQNVWEQDQSAIAPFVAQMGDQMNYRVASDVLSPDKTGAMAVTWMQAAGQNGIPCSFLIDRQGKIAWIGHPMNLAPILAQVVNGTYDSLMAFGTRDMQVARNKNDYDAELRLLDAADKTSGNLQWTKKWRFGALMNKKDYPAAYALAQGLVNSPSANPRMLGDIAQQILYSNAAKPNFDLANQLISTASENADRAHLNDPLFSLDLKTTQFNLLLRKGDYAAAAQVATQIGQSPVVEPNSLLSIESTLIHNAPADAAVDFAVAGNLLDRAALLTNDASISFQIHLYRIDLLVAKKDVPALTAEVDVISRLPQLTPDALPWLVGQALVDQPALAEKLLAAAKQNAKDANGRALVEKTRFDILINKKDYAHAYAVASALTDSPDASIQPLNDMAWDIATKDGIEQRDLKLAEKMAAKASALSQGNDPDITDTWSRVLFENGEYDKAITMEKQVVDHTTGQQQAQLLGNLIGYDLRLGRFQDALAGYSKALHDDQSVVLSWAYVGALQLYLDDMEGYKTTCRAMLQRFSKTTDTNEAAQTSKLCLLAPEAVDDMTAVRRLADLGLTSPNYAAPGLTFVLGKGMAEYRAGHFLEAVDWLKRCPDSGPSIMSDLQNTVPWVHCAANFYMAMAQHRLGQDTLAHGTFASAQQQFNASVPTVQSHGPDVGNIRWLIAQLARREATAMLSGTGVQVTSQAR